MLKNVIKNFLVVYVFIKINEVNIFVGFFYLNSWEKVFFLVFILLYLVF